MWRRYSRERALKSSKVRAIGNLNLNFEISNLLFAAQKTLQDRRGRPLRTARTEEANACELSAWHALPRRRTEEGVGHAEALGLVSRARVRRRKRVASEAWIAYGPAGPVAESSGSTWPRSDGTFWAPMTYWTKVTGCLADL